MIAIATELLHREALLLDTQRWDEWLALFTADARFWVPAWKAEHTPTDDPKRELSLIYYADRGGLEDRVWRARSGRSVASVVLPRTHHAITNILLLASVPEHSIDVASYSTTHVYSIKDKAVEVYFARVEHRLVRRDDSWRIAAKKIVLLNDYLPAKLDFYTI